MASTPPESRQVRSTLTFREENDSNEETVGTADAVQQLVVRDDLEDEPAKSNNTAECGKETGSTTNDQGSTNNATTTPPLPVEAPPLPAEAAPDKQEEEDDGWAPVWEPSAQAFYFYNRFTGASQWTNPRVPDPIPATAPGVEPAKADAMKPLTSPPPPTEGSLPAGGYNPAIHGDYDPDAWYAQPSISSDNEAAKVAATDPNSQYAATAAFNRFTGRFQNSELNPENFNDENKSKRQMNAFFDVDAAANSHDGRSLKAERSGKKLTKTELKQFKEKRKARKEEKRRAWLKD